MDATGGCGAHNVDTYCPACATLCMNVLDSLKNERTKQKGAPLKRNFAEALRETASLTGVSESTLRRMEKRVDPESGVVNDVQPKGNFTSKVGIEYTWALGKRKDGNGYNTVQDLREITLQYLIEAEAVGRNTLRKDIVALWRREFGIDAVDNQAGSCLRRWGFFFREQISTDKIKKGVGIVDERVLKDMERYYVDYNNARDAGYEFIYQDESFCGEYHRSKCSWFSSETAYLKTKGNGIGRLITISDVGSAKYGWIYGVRRVQSTSKSDQKSDYHKYWTAESFIAYFKEILKALRAYKVDGHIQVKFAIVIDNAPTHTTLEDGTPYPSDMNAQQLKDFCIQHDLKSYNDLDKHTIAYTRPLAKKIWSLNRPLTAVQKLAEKEGHIVIYTPRTQSIYNPIEEAWAIGKNYVARNYNPDYPMHAAMQNIVTGLNLVTQETWEKLVRSERKFCSLMVKRTDSLTIRRA
jgi:hypothetical protein